VTAEAAPDAGGAIHVGEPFRITETTSISELCANPEKYFNREVRIEGTVASACTEDGCFLEVAAEDGTGEGILVSLWDPSQRFPVGCEGAHAVVEGLFYRKIYPAGRVQHWRSHSFRKIRPVPEFSMLLRVGARAASVTLERGPVPIAAEIHAASTDAFDLGATEFEADGFGTGRKWLEPGEIVHSHSTGGSRELVYCLEGEITVVRPDHPIAVLHAGEATYLPPGTQHEMRNASDRPAAYVFVFAKACAP
jgi:quercetin dioxygenase-like cupin family protein